MEVGAVKQAFNNEVIQLKRNFNQAKIQIIHKLTRKAKTFTEKKAPDKLKEKLKRKAESAVNEVLLMKKIKPKVLAKFAVTHTGNLQDYLNKPIVNQDKACARLLLHKSLQAKYNYIRNTFSNIPINDLLMSRLERRKMKKEALEKQKMKRDKKQKVVNTEGDWEVENLKTGKNTDLKTLEKDEVSDDDNMGSDGEANSGEEKEQSDDEELNDDRKSGSDEEQNDNSAEEVGETMETDEESDHGKDSDDNQDTNGGKFVQPSPVKPKMISNNKQSKNDKTKIKPETNKPTKSRDSNSKMETDEESDHGNESTEEESGENDDDKDVGKFVRPSPAKDDVKSKEIPSEKPTKNAKPAQAKNKIKPEIKKPTKPRDPNKNKKLNEKLISRNFKKDLNDAQVKETKIVDPFFITATGENYMSVSEPRQPDEVKEIHKQGNRQLRRAAMFGHAPKIKPRQDFREGNFNRQNDSQGFRNKSYSGDGNYKRNEGQFNDRNDSQFRGRNDNSFRGRNDNRFKGNDKFRGGKDSQFKGNRNDSQFKGKNDSFRGRNDVERKEEKLHPSWEAKKKKSGLLPFQGKKIVFDES